jgi:hypothetical protein
VKWTVVFAREVAATITTTTTTPAVEMWTWIAI